MTVQLCGGPRIPADRGCVYVCLRQHSGGDIRARQSAEPGEGVR